MYYNSEIREAIEDAVTIALEAMPKNIDRLIDLATQDLYHGPIYLDENGETCEWFDEGATPFDFKGACNEIRDWLDENILDIKIETSYDEEADKSEYESIDGTGKVICEKLLGKELLAMIY